jgi:gliding motility-associated protein GldM
MLLFYAYIIKQNNHFFNRSIQSGNMSIPKEPRQLMINLMYLVLTAMLALNVSAEIINAFFALEKGITNSSNIVDKNIVGVTEALKVSVSANPKYASWQTKADQAKKIGAEFETYVEEQRLKMFELGGGKHPDHPDRPYHYKDKDVTTNYFVTQGNGTKLEEKIKATRDAYLALIDAEDKKQIAESMPLAAEEIPADAKEAGVKTWAELKFKQMPIAAVMPTLAKIKNDSKNSTAAILNYCLDKASGKIDYKPDSYICAIAPKKAYLITGRDKFEADITMGAYSSTSSAISITANGSGLKIDKGIAHYSGGTESTPGEKTFTATATLRNPATGQATTVKGEFKYEVGQASATVSADMMNVFYIGVDNPITIAAAGVSSNKLQVSGSGGGISLSGTGKSRVVRVSTPTVPGQECKVTVSAGTEMAAVSFPFRVKRIPDPVAKLGKESSGQMGTGEFKAQGGVMAVLENFDFNAKCEIVGFEFTRAPKRDDAVTNINVGPRYDAKSTLLRDQAKPGDMYYFDNIKAKCPGDPAARKINPMVWKIK